MDGVDTTTRIWPICHPKVSSGYLFNRGRSGMKNMLISLIYKDLAFGYLFMIPTEFDHDILF